MNSGSRKKQILINIHLFVILTRNSFQTEYRDIKSNYYLLVMLYVHVIRVLISRI